MYIDIEGYLDGVKKQLGANSKTYAALARVFQEYPTLRAHRDGVVRLCMAGANPFVDQVDIDRGGQDIYIRPFVEYGGVAVYSDPPLFYVGSRNSSGFGVFPAPGWLEEMEASDINVDMIRKVKDFMLENVSYDLPET